MNRRDRYTNIHNIFTLIQHAHFTFVTTKQNTTHTTTTHTHTHHEASCRVSCVHISCRSRGESRVDLSRARFPPVRNYFVNREFTIVCANQQRRFSDRHCRATWFLCVKGYAKRKEIFQNKYQSEGIIK